MKTGIGNYYLNKYGLEAGALKMAEDGYECIDFDFSDTDTEYYTKREEDFLASMLEIKKTLAKAGISVHQIHGPWRTPVRDGTEDERAERFGKMTKAMVMAKHLGARYMAVYPLMPFGQYSAEKPDEVYAINKKYYEALAKVGAGLGVVVCLENTPFPDFPLSSCEQILRLVEDINSPYLKICFDTGHANILGEPLGDTLRLLREKVKIIHAHDNDRERDAHLPPYEGEIDWSDFAEGLYDIEFDGALILKTEPTEYKSGTDGEKEKELAKIARLIAG